MRVEGMRIRLPLYGEPSEEDCSAANAMMHARVDESASMAAVQRGLVRAAEFEAADRLRPSILLARDAEGRVLDCSAANALMHAMGLRS